MIDRGIECAGTALGRAVALASAAVGLPGRLATPSGPRVDPDVGRLGALPIDEARRVPVPDGGDPYTTAHGDGPAFLFVHGFAMTSRVWTKQLRDLPRARVRAVAFDHRGHGASTATLSDPTIELLADDVRAVVEGLDLRDALLVGHSMGGMALLAFALRHPEVAAARTRGLVLVSTAARLGVAAVPLAARVVTPVCRGFVRSGAWAHSDWSRIVARALFGADPPPSQVELTRVLLCGFARAHGVAVGLAA